MDPLYLIGRLIALSLTVAAFLGARRIVAASVGIPQAFVPFRRFDMPAAGVPRWARPAIVCVGAIAVYLVASLFFAVAAYVGGEVTVSSDSTIDVVPGGPAEHAGVRDGDRIVRIASRPVNTWKEVMTVIREHEREASIEFVLEHNGVERTLMIEPVMTEHGARIGITGAGRVVDVGVGKALVQGIAHPAQFVYELARSLSGSPIFHPVPVPAKTPRTPSTAYAFLLLQLMGYLSLLIGIIVTPMGAFGWRPIVSR